MSKLTISIVLIYQFFYFQMKEKKFIEKVLFFSYIFSLPQREERKWIYSSFFFLVIFFILTFFLPYFLRSKQSLRLFHMTREWNLNNNPIYWWSLHEIYPFSNSLTFFLAWFLLTSMIRVYPSLSLLPVPTN